MGSLEVIFATVVGVLAAIAVIGALIFAIIWEVCAIKRVLADHRDATNDRPLTDADFWRQQRALNEPQ